MEINWRSNVPSTKSYLSLSAGRSQPGETVLILYETLAAMASEGRSEGRSRSRSRSGSTSGQHSEKKAVKKVGPWANKIQLLRNAETAATLLPFVTVDGSEAPVDNPESQQYLRGSVCLTSDPRSNNHSGEEGDGASWYARFLQHRCACAIGRAC